jgi:hypothetical protein
MSLLGFARPDDWTGLSSKLARGLTAGGLATTVAALIDLGFVRDELSIEAVVGGAGLA